MSAQDIDKLGTIIGPMLRAARVPGAAIAVVARGETVYASGFGFCDLTERRPVTPNTVYPIASTSKAINATLLGMLVDEGRIEWDAPVQQYLPFFRLSDTVISPRVTVRDLLTMRTGLPRHDWVWWGSKVNRVDLVERMAHLDLSADFRQRFQYSNLSATAAGHIAEVVTGKSWETLVHQRIFRPLGMRSTSCVRPTRRNVTSSVHETARRKLVPSRRHASEAIAPAGGAVYSTVADMSRWVLFNLRNGKIPRRRLIAARTLAQIHAPQLIVGDRPLTRLPADGAYALGWLVDYYNGHRRISHGGYLHDVQSSVMFFPDLDIGMTSFINLGGPLLADLFNQYAFDLMMHLKPVQTLAARLADYETSITDTLKRNSSVARATNTRPSHPLRAYLGKYEHPAYGEIEICRLGRKLLLQRHHLRLLLQHWHYDIWVAGDDDMWAIHQSHAFDRACQIQFHAETQGQISRLSIPFEPETAPVQFEKRRPYL